MVSFHWSIRNKIQHFFQTYHKSRESWQRKRKGQIGRLWGEKLIHPFLCSFLNNTFLMQIFFPCCQSAPDMPLWLIHIQNFSCLGCQGRIDLGETFCYIFMYRTLANPKFFSCLPHSGIFLNYIISYIDCPLFYVPFQRNSLIHCFFIMYEEFSIVMTTLPSILWEPFLFSAAALCQNLEPSRRFEFFIVLITK